MQKKVSQNCDTMSEKLIVNRADIKSLHDHYLAQVHTLRAMLQLPPLLTDREQRRVERVKSK